MTLAKHLISTFPDPPPYLDRAIDETLVAELLPDQPRRVNHIMGVVARGREVEERYGAESATGRSMRMMEPEFSEIHRRVSAIIVDRARLPGYAAAMHGSIHPRLSAILSLGVLLATLSACAPHYTDSDPPPPHWAPNPNPFQVPP
jgi:hypothetical protein